MLLDGPRLTGRSLIPIPSFNLILFIGLYWSCSCCSAWVSVAWPFQGIPAQFPTANTCVSLHKGFSGHWGFLCLWTWGWGINKPSSSAPAFTHNLRIGVQLSSLSSLPSSVLSPGGPQHGWAPRVTPSWGPFHPVPSPRSQTGASWDHSRALGPLSQGCL